MGLILSTLTAAGSTLRDQWKEYFYCEAIPNNILAVKGQKTALTAEVTTSFLMDLLLR